MEQVVPTAWDPTHVIVLTPGMRDQTVIQVCSLVFLSIDTESIKFRSLSQVWWVAKF